MALAIIWRAANQFLAGVDLMIGLYVLSIAGMGSLLYVKRWLND